MYPRVLFLPVLPGASPWYPGPVRPAVLLLLLFPLLIGSGVALAWQRAGQDRYAKLEREGEILAGVVAGAAVEAAEALTLAEEKLEAQLAAVARRADAELAHTRMPSAEVLQQVATEERVGRIFYFDATGAPVAQARWPAPVRGPDAGPLGAGSKRDLKLRNARRSVETLAPKPGQVVSEGRRTNLFGTRERFGLLLGRADGSTLLVRADANDLAALERRFGLQHMVDRMVELDPVQAIGLRSPDGSLRVLKEAGGDADPEPLRTERHVAIRGGVHTVEIDLSRRGADEAVARARMAILLGGLLALLISLAAAVLLLRLEAARRREADLAAARLEEERRLAEMGALAGLVTHEVNNPLNALRLGVRVLKDAGTPDPGGVLQTMNTEVERMAKTLEGYMGLARSEGRAAEAVGPEVVTRVLERTAEEAARLGVTQRFSPRGDEPAALADPVVLEQALSNVVRNALQASPRGASVQLSWQRDDDKVAITVTDAGPGFPEDRTALLRLGGTNRDGGHGLGLPLAKRFVEGHGGTLSLEDAPEGGGRVVLRLPIAEEGAPPA